MTVRTYLKECFKWLPIGIVALPILALCIVGGDYPSDGSEFWTKKSHSEVLLPFRWLHNILVITFVLGPASVVLIFLAVKFNIWF